MRATAPFVLGTFVATTACSSKSSDSESLSVTVTDVPVTSGPTVSRRGGGVVSTTWTATVSAYRFTRDGVNEGGRVKVELKGKQPTGDLLTIDFVINSRDVAPKTYTPKSGGSFGLPDQKPGEMGMAVDGSWFVQATPSGGVTGRLTVEGGSVTINDYAMAETGGVDRFEISADFNDVSAVDDDDDLIVTGSLRLAATSGTTTDGGTTPTPGSAVAHCAQNRNGAKVCSELVSGDGAAYIAQCTKGGDTGGTGQCPSDYRGGPSCTNASATSSGTPVKLNFYWASGYCDATSMGIDTHGTCCDLGGTPIGTHCRGLSGGCP